ncbi:hypothetical protein ABEB36_004759 [Hypothenemus hampei]|uniref:Uncharacterized protein n=1 Tax=Hypothenemus hampei TaxID=57062 RepID=A0ABD1EVS0_HYPHA
MENNTEEEEEEEEEEENQKGSVTAGEGTIQEFFSIYEDDMLSDIEEENMRGLSSPETQCPDLSRSEEELVGPQDPALFVVGNELAASSQTHVIVSTPGASSNSRQGNAETMCQESNGEVWTQNLVQNTRTAILDSKTKTAVVLSSEEDDEEEIRKKRHREHTPPHPFFSPRKDLKETMLGLVDIVGKIRDDNYLDSLQDIGKGKSNAEEDRLRQENKVLSDRLAKMESEADSSRKLEGRVLKKLEKKNDELREKIKQLEKEKDKTSSSDNGDTEHDRELARKETLKRIEQIINKPKKGFKECSEILDLMWSAENYKCTELKYKDDREPGDRVYICDINKEQNQKLTNGFNGKYIFQNAIAGEKLQMGVWSTA